MQVTFNQYIQNPMGIKNAVFSNREMYRDLYTEKFNAIMTSNQDRINHTVYKDTEFRYLIHFKIPSETVRNFFYDVVLEFYTSDKNIALEKTLINYNVRFFSNDPSFVFTFAHAFLHNQIFIKDLVPRMSKEAVKKAAKEKNPSKQVGYVKAIYFAYLFMQKKKLFTKIVLDAKPSKPYNKTELLKNVKHTDDLLKARELEVKKEQLKKDEEKKEKKRIKNLNKNHDMKVASSYNNAKHTKQSTVSNISKVSKIQKVSKKAMMTKKISKR